MTGRRVGSDQIIDIMFFTDLTKYEYGLPHPIEDVVNIGWLEKMSSFETAKPSAIFIARLHAWTAVARVNLLRGYHECGFCSGIKERPSVDIDGVRIWLGSSEIWIPGKEGRVYAAPDLLIHYIESHQYEPPQEFMEAVLAVENSDHWNASQEYEKRTIEAFTR